MFQAELQLQQEKSCVLDDFAEHFETSFNIAIEELHDHLVTFVINIDQPRQQHLEFFSKCSSVKNVDQFDENSYLVTKVSCGAYSAIDRNHCILRRNSSIHPNRRVYTVLFFRREDLKAMIKDFDRIGTVTLGKVTKFTEPESQLTDRQLEVVQCALESGYFEWPREINSEELAEKLDINRATALEHLRKAESKLLADALENQKQSRTSPPQPNLDTTQMDHSPS
ncbi:helix-turn-helix domain-containing protein [Halalkalicoccus subterraneus]|uniref:helix-turn-helix domain-containing protein n=1 Tax=Halalkalicoccus subterraneus TaxID=2675002 RepID=UPI000EFA902A|nr:helix-turn-helix domain-containing protein [Halalkalicoccus subterraneus]